MNQTIKELSERKSVRVFEQREIGAKEKQAILTAAVMAPTAGNQQLYTIIDITDEAKKQRLAVLCDNQPFIASAQLVLIFCADCKKWYDAYTAVGCKPRSPGVGDLLLAVSDANIAAQNTVTAAWSMGIGSCYIGDVMEQCEPMRELLGLPEYVFPAAMLVYGYPTEQQKQREKPQRAAMQHIVHENTYRSMDESELRQMLEYKAGQRQYADWLRAFCERKYDSDFSREMTRSVAEYLKDFESIKK